MIILGIETSCDETACALVENGTKVLTNVVVSSIELHAKTGGIIPENAARRQVEAIMPVINKALANRLITANNNTQKSTDNVQGVIDQIDAIAVTRGPGLIGSLLVGVETAKTLAYLWNKPVVPINHLVAHIYANLFENEASTKKRRIVFPALALVVSGGHTDLVLMTNHQHLKWIGGTRDDAAGEAFDKTARLLGLDYPGGPAIAKAAEKFLLKNPGSELNIFPRPMINSKNFDWSFSGLKTAVVNKVQTNQKLTKEQLAAEIQEAIIDVLVRKSVKAVIKYQPKSFLLAGGVAANKRLRDKFASSLADMKVIFQVPVPKYCTDNAAAIAGCAFFKFHPVSWQKINADPQLEITTRGK